MIKLTFCLVRLPNLSREAFQAYWFDTHGPLVASVADELKIRRYVQLHSLPAEASAGLRASRSAPATGTSACFRARRISSNNARRRRTRINTSPSCAGRHFRDSLS